MLILSYLLLSILAIILLSAKFKLNPAISLFIGGIILGLLLKIGLLETLRTLLDINLEAESVRKIFFQDLARFQRLSGTPIL